jgi:replication-associated recombination protein RarA
MSKLVMHPSISQTIETTAKASPHAIMIVGPVGSGKAAVAQSLAEMMLTLPVNELTKYPYARVVKPAENGSIGIDSVRDIERFLSLKVPGVRQINRAVIIEDAHSMTLEAQNALLKNLEEPPDGTVLIITSQSVRSVLPTITSRTQAFQLRRPDKQSLTEHFSKLGSSTKDIERAYTMSGGLPGLMAAVLADTDHPLLNATEAARELLSKSAYDRLMMVDSLAKDKQQAMQLTYILQQMAHVSLQNASGAAASRWQSILAAAYACSEAIESSAQLKLALTNLMLHL